jgi:hypothetical protein
VLLRLHPDRGRSDHPVPEVDHLRHGAVPLATDAADIHHRAAERLRTGPLEPEHLVDGEGVGGGPAGGEPLPLRRDGERGEDRGRREDERPRGEEGGHPGEEPRRTPGRLGDDHQLRPPHRILDPVGDLVDRGGLEGADHVPLVGAVPDDVDPPGPLGVPGDGAADGSEPEDRE